LRKRTGRRRSATHGGTTRHPGYEICRRIRTRIEEAFAWAESVAASHQPENSQTHPLFSNLLEMVIKAVDTAFRVSEGY
jgi:hypothetical protein